MSGHPRERILVVDDNSAIHADLRKILAPVDGMARELADLRSTLFGHEESRSPAPRRTWSLEFASQGLEGIELARSAREEGRPFSVAIVDMRMPPGIDGLETIERLWRDDANLQAVLCTAFSDRSYEEIRARLGDSDRLLILKKPFDPAEIQQIAGALAAKWRLSLEVAATIADLEARVAEKTAALEARLCEVSRQNAALETANAEAASASRAKTDFLTNMSHEIRTPMTAILGFADFLADPHLSREHAADHVATIRRNGEHLLGLINDILDLSKIEADALVLESVPLAPAQTIEEVRALLGPRASEKGVELEARVEPSTPGWILGDPLRLRQVLVNLVGNAIKFTENGSVCLRARSTSPTRVEFEVVDSGIGIEPAALARLFQPFSQADSSTSRRYGGTGLGLSITRRLVERMGGKIEVTSRVGAGSTFRIELPVVRVAAPERKNERQPVSVAERGLVGRRILVAEDGRDNQLLLKTILHRAGAVVELAENGRVAVERFDAAIARGEPHELVLMDMQMPELDGYAATRELRAKGSAVPVIALTAHAMTGDRERCLAAGCSDYATKPIDRARLLELCGRLVVPAPIASRSADLGVDAYRE